MVFSMLGGVREPIDNDGECKVGMLIIGRINEHRLFVESESIRIIHLFLFILHDSINSIL